MASHGSTLVDGHDVVAAIDLGTHGTGLSVAFPTAEHATDVSRALSDIVVLKPGDRSSARSDKALTAILLDLTTQATMAFGEKARKTYAKICDEAKGKSSCAYYHTFKMLLQPGPSRPRDLSKIMGIPSKQVTAGAGSKESASDIPLSLIFQRAFEFVREELFAFLKTRIVTRDPTTLKVLWVITVPAIWDDEGKDFMRTAAFKAGLIDSSDSPNLVLALEPECAILASIADCTPTERDGFKPGTNIMVVDCGGGTVDITIDKVESIKPLCLREIAEATGGPWGATYVDRQFVAFCKELVGDKWKYVDHAMQLQLLTDWETAKLEVGCDSSEGVAIPLTELIDQIAETEKAQNPGAETFDKESMRACLEALNSKLGLDGENAITLSKGKRLTIPDKIARGFFQPIITKITDHIGKLLDANAATNNIDVIVLAGGFAESPLLRRAMIDRYSTRCRIVLPKRPGAVVNIGAALYALQPQMIKSRVMRWTYAYVGAEPFNPLVHDERHKFVTAEGRHLCNILYPLVQKGDCINIGDDIERKGLVPVRADQVMIDFEIYRTTDKVVNPRKEPAAVRSVPVDSKADQGKNIGILKSDKVAQLSVLIGASDRPRTERTVNLLLNFAATEISARAEATHSDDKKKVQITYT